MTLFALLKGNTTFKDIFAWMTFNQENEILKIIFEKEKINIPSRSTLHALEAVFREYFIDYIIQKNIAIDGKWLNGSDVNGQYTQESHKAMLNILDKDIKIVFGHKFLDKNKRSEIIAENEHRSEYLKAINDKNELFKFIDESIQNSMNLLE